MEGNKPLYGVVGSRTYMAPEVVKNTGYGKPVDMYSIGVIMYILYVSWLTVESRMYSPGSWFCITGSVAILHSTQKLAYSNWSSQALTGMILAKQPRILFETCFKMIHRKE